MHLHRESEVTIRLAVWNSSKRRMEVRHKIECRGRTPCPNNELLKTETVATRVKKAELCVSAGQTCLSAAGGSPSAPLSD